MNSSSCSNPSVADEEEVRPSMLVCLIAPSELLGFRENKQQASQVVRLCTDEAALSLQT